MRMSDAFPSKYLKAGDLKDRDVTLTIREVTIERVGENREQKPVVYFSNRTEKGLVLNVTNYQSIAIVLGSDESDDWGGQSITLFPSETEFRGEPTTCIRVRRKTKSKSTIAPAISEERTVLDDDEIPI